MPETVHALVCSWFTETTIPKVARHTHARDGVMGSDDLEVLIKELARLATAARTTNLLLSRWFLMKAIAAHQAGFAYAIADQVDQVCLRNRVRARMLHALPRQLLAALENRFGVTLEDSEDFELPGERGRELRDGREATVGS